MTDEPPDADAVDAPSAEPSEADGGSTDGDSGPSDDDAASAEQSDGAARGPYEAVFAHPDADATAARQVKTAAEYGFAGVVVRTREADYSAEDLADIYGVDVVPGVEVVADDPEGASGAVGNFRSDHVVVAVRGGTPRLNRFAVEQDRVDVLARPFADEGDVNHVLANAAADHDVRIEFDLGPVLRSTGGGRVRHLQQLRKLRELVEDAGAAHVVSASPTDHLQLRAPRDLAAVGEAVGLGGEFVREGLREWGRLAARNRERLSESFISPGVERGRYEE